MGHLLKIYFGIAFSLELYQTKSSNIVPKQNHHPHNTVAFPTKGGMCLIFFPILNNFFPFNFHKGC